jgi:hypothetical protein
MEWSALRIFLRAVKASISNPGAALPLLTISAGKVTGSPASTTLKDPSACFLLASIPSLLRKGSPAGARADSTNRTETIAFLTLIVDSVKSTSSALARPCSIYISRAYLGVCPSTVM